MASPSFQLDPSLANLPLDLLKKKYDELTPEERRMLGFTRQASQQQFEDSQQQGGAPADFSGRVLQNPGNVQISDDTDSGIPALRLPNGVAATTGAYTGTPKLDTSNPAQAQVIQPAMQEIGADFSGKLPPGAELETSGSQSVKLPPGAELETPLKTEAAKKEEPGWLDKEIPLDSYTHATEQGLQNIARGVKQAGEGAYEMVKPPQTPGEKRLTAIPGALQIYRTLHGIVETGKAATEVPAAIHDINQSDDPLGTYGQVASRTAGEGGGQALAALATEGVSKAVPKIAPALETAKDAAKTAVNNTAAVVRAVDPDVVGIISPRAAHTLKVAQRAAKVAEKYSAPASEAAAEAPKPTTAPIERDATLDSRNIPEYAGEEETSQPVNAAAERTTAKPPAVKPAKVEELLSKSLGNEPLKPGVALKDQAKPNAAPMQATGLPEGFKPVKSSAIKGYKYNPEAQEFESVTNSGSHYIHGDVSPEQAQAFEAADSKGKAWSDLKNNSTYVGKVVNGKRVAVIPPKELGSATPESASAPEQAGNSVQSATKKPVASASDDLTAQLQKSLDQVNAKKSAASIPEVQSKGMKSGVMTTADPGMLADRWGASEKSIADTDAQLRGKSPQESQDYINKLAESYKKGQPVHPVMETRDAANNIIEVDGRHRALAAKKAGIERIPIIVRRLGVTAK